MMNYKIERKPKSFWKSHWLLIVTVLVFILLGSALVKEIMRSKKVNQEILTLQEQIINLEQKNSEQKNFVEYLKTDYYFEEQARLKLGLKKSGEKVVFLENSTDAGVMVTPPTNRSDQDYSNARRWFNYFFGG